MTIRRRGTPVSKQPPVFVPTAYYDEVMSLSKATLADMVWDYAEQLAGSRENRVTQDLAGDDAILAEFRARREIILNYRKQDK